MNAANDPTMLVDDLAGYWTEPVLKILRSMGIPISVDTEVEAWRTLKKVLHAKLHWQRTLRSSTLPSMSALMEPTRTDFVPRLRVLAESANVEADAAI